MMRYPTLMAGRRLTRALDSANVPKIVAAVAVPNTTFVHPSRSAVTMKSLSNHRRSYSSTSPSLQQIYTSKIKRAFPQYSVFGDDCLLSIKPLFPTFKPAGDGGVSLDRKGKIMVTFTPIQHFTGSSPGGPAADGGGRGPRKLLWQEQLAVALSVEEVGLLVNQLPSFPVEIARDGPRPGTEGTGNTEYGMQQQQQQGAEISDAPDKVLSFTPGEGATVTVKIDFVRDGVGGQLSAAEPNSSRAPMSVLCHAGEFEVIRTLLQSSIPHLIGWDTMVNISVNDSLQKGGTGNDGGYGGY